jgi:hypothetical protein
MTRGIRVNDGGLNLQLAWAWLLAGLVAGAVQGLFFHREDWLGGYASWPRRMTRLGHVSFLGTALVNVLAVLTAREAAIPVPGAAWVLLACGAVTMPAVCYGAAFRKPVRHLFAIPVLCLVSGVALVVGEVLR